MKLYLHPILIFLRCEDRIGTMKITRRHLRRLIKEELSHLLEVDSEKIAALTTALADLDKEKITVSQAEELEADIDAMQQDVEASG